MEPTELNVATTSLGREIARRSPWMLFSLAAGIVMVIIGQNFEATFIKKIELIFYIPMIVYVSSVIGMETLTLFVRELALRKFNLMYLLWREMVVGLVLGAVVGIPMGLFGYWWLKDFKLGLVIALTMMVNGLVAVVIGMLTPIIFARFKQDPALGSEEIATALSDIISILIYLVVATLLLFGLS